MTLNLTRGGLSPAKITNLDNNDEVKFMFNPYEYSVTKSNEWSPEGGMGKNLPEYNFQKGGAKTVALKLHFDRLAENKDVRDFTHKLWNMMMIVESNENTRSGKSEPPPVAFEWGRLYFKGIITSMTESITLFSPDGTPLRCVVDISLQQYSDERSYRPQDPSASAGQPAPHEAVMIGGDRLDNVAASSGSSHREIAAANNIDDPTNIPAGTSLSVPK